LFLFDFIQKILKVEKKKVGKTVFLYYQEKREGEESRDEIHLSQQHAQMRTMDQETAHNFHSFAFSSSSVLILSIVVRIFEWIKSLGLVCIPLPLPPSYISSPVSSTTTFTSSTVSSKNFHQGREIIQKSVKISGRDKGKLEKYTGWKGITDLQKMRRGEAGAKLFKFQLFFSGPY